MKELIKKHDEEFEILLEKYREYIESDRVENIYAEESLIEFIDKVRKETAEYEKNRIKEKVEDWRRGFSMTCAESDVYKKAHQQILKVLKDI